MLQLHPSAAKVAFQRSHEGKPQQNRVSPACLWGQKKDGRWISSAFHVTGGSRLSHYTHTEISYKLILSNNNSCPHLLQHAPPALAISPANSFRSELWGGGWGRGGSGCFVIDRLCLNRGVCVMQKKKHQLLHWGLDNKHVGFHETWENTSR